MAKKTHGMSKSREFKIWSDLKQRCYNKNSPGYKHYGARGIKLCPAWVESFQHFFEDMGPAQKNDSIVRIDINEDYCYENCRWSSSKQFGFSKKNTPFGRKKKFKEPIPISFLMEKNFKKHILRTAKIMSEDEGRYVSFSEACLRGLETAYPHSQLKMDIQGKPWNPQQFATE